MQVGNFTAGEMGSDPTSGETESAAEAINRDPHWVAEFDRQLEPHLVDRVRSLIRPHAFAVACAGRKIDDHYTRTLVTDVLGDTWLGKLKWDPAKCSLAYHLRRAAQGHAHKDREHAEAHPHESLGDDCESSRCAERDASELVAKTQQVATRLYAHEVMQQIRAEAHNDKGLLRVLDAYDAGAQKKEEVLAHANMKERTYHNAHGRLKRIVRKLTDSKLAPHTRAEME